MRTIVSLAATVFLLQTSLAAPCDQVKGTGAVVKRSLAVNSFHGITVEGSIDVVLTKGTAQKVEVEAQQNIAELVTTEVNGGVWTIGTSKSYSTDKTFTVHITVPVIDEVHIYGSGDVSGDEAFETGRVELSIEGSGDIDLAFNASEVIASIAGSGDMKLKGDCTKLNVSIQGSGDVNARGLKAEEAVVATAGSGDVTLTATGSLAATVEGSGDVVFSGNPSKVSRNVAGSGEVRGEQSGGRL